jgi:hypothetical protein
MAPGQSHVEKEKALEVTADFDEKVIKELEDMEGGAGKSHSKIFFLV